MVNAINTVIAEVTRRCLGPLALAVLVTAVITAADTAPGQAAESPPRLATMAVSVMPEYDQPRVLVSYRGDLNADVSLPLQARLRLPADAEVNQVCSIIQQPEEEHLCQPYSVEPDGPYVALTWEAITPVMYVEFYYGSVSGAGQRSLDFSFWAPYPVQNLDLFVLEPAAATDFSLSPAPTEVVEEQGFRHHTYSFQDVSVDEPVNIEMTYVRQTDQPSAPPRAAAVGAADDTGGIPQGVILALGLAGAAALVFAIYSFLARRYRVRAVAVSAQAPADQSNASQEGAFFCRHCGAGVRQGSAFCPACGQEVGPPPGDQG